MRPLLFTAACCAIALSLPVFADGVVEATVEGVRVDTHMVYDDYVYRDDLAEATARPAVSTMKVERREGTNLFDIHYKVDDADSATVEVVGMVMSDAVAPAGGVRFANQFVCALSAFVEGSEAAIGASVQTGTMQHLVWDAGADLAESTPDIYIRLLVSDGRPLLSLHFIEIPADDPEPAFEISRYAGLGNPGMIDNVWLWLLAKGQVRAEGDKLYAVGGTFAGELLATGHGALTTMGRDYLMAYIGGVRLATSAELQRAKEASTPGTITQWEPFRKSAGRPVNVNEYGLETAGPADFYLVRVQN